MIKPTKRNLFFCLSLSPSPQRKEDGPRKLVRTARNFSMLLQNKMKNLSKFFFKRITNSILTFDSKTRFFFSLLLSLSLFSFASLLTTFFFVETGMTALDEASVRGFESIVKILLENGANTDLRNSVFLFLFSFSFFFFLEIDFVVKSVMVRVVVCVRLCFCFFFFFFFNFPFLF